MLAGNKKGREKKRAGKGEKECERVKVFSLAASHTLKVSR